MSALFNPVKIGRYTAKNRIFMAPMSRYRAPDAGLVTEITVDYYRQRASAGLIIAESTQVNEWSGGINCPGIYSEEQVAAWQKVTDAVHEEGGLIFLQLWHSGRAAHQSLLPEGRLVSAPSAIASKTDVMTENGMETPPIPKALTLEEISELRRDFVRANRNALKAGFDGVELHAAGGFLIDSFLQDHSNIRLDEYGGSLENRFRFLREVTEDTIEIWGADRTGIKLSPTSQYNDMAQGNVRETFAYVISELNTYGVAFLEVNEEMPFGEIDPADRRIVEELRALWTAPYIGNGNYNAETGALCISENKADAISFGRPFIANPDLPARYRQNGPFNALDPNTFYGGDHRGLTDYPMLEAETSSAA